MPFHDYYSLCSYIYKTINLFLLTALFIINYKVKKKSHKIKNCSHALFQMRTPPGFGVGGSPGAVW